MQPRNRNFLELASIVITVMFLLWGWFNAIIHADRAVVMLGSLCSFWIIGLFILHIFLPNPDKEYSDKVHDLLRDLSIRRNTERKAGNPDLELLVKITQAERELLGAHEYNKKSWLVKTDPDFSLRKWRTKWKY
jgi:hypothetical protein